MQLVKASIHNFRGIQHAEFNLRDYSLIVGPNNAGKSTVIDAIRVFYEKDGYKYKKERDQPYSINGEHDSWIELTYNLSSNEKSTLAKHYQRSDFLLPLIKFLNISPESENHDKSTGVIYCRLEDGTINKDQFFGAKNVQSGKIGDIIYIPAVSKVDEHTKLTGPSPLRDLLTDILTNVLDDSEAYQEFEQSVNQFAKSISEAKTNDNRSINDLQIRLNECLKPWQTEFMIRFKSPSIEEIIKQMLGWEIIDGQHNSAVSIENYGSGFQRHFFYSLIQLRTIYSKQINKKRNTEFNPELTLLLFEEPEAFLHPPQQESLARSLRSLGTDTNWQVICTTHSSNFVSRRSDSLFSIIRVKRKQGVTMTYQINNDIWQEIFDSNMNVLSIKEIEAHAESQDRTMIMEEAKHFIWLSPDRSSAFFADHVLIVEGQSEVSLIVRLMDDELIVPNCSVHVIDGCGKYNIHRFITLLSHLGIDHSVIHDDDRYSKEASKNSQLHQLIQSVKHPQLTFKIIALPDQLESFLGIPTTTKKGSKKSNHSKPQNLLYYYCTQQINFVRLSEFCNLVMSCIPSELNE